MVLTEDARRFAEQMGIRLFETSAKDNINVEEMFRAVTELVLKSKKVSIIQSIARQEMMNVECLCFRTKKNVWMTRPLMGELKWTAEADPWARKPRRGENAVNSLHPEL